MKRMITSLVLALGLALSPLAAAAQDKLPIRIGFQSGDINVILMYGLNTGLFEKAGLEVKTATFPAGPAMLPALAANEIDIAWMGEFPVVTGYSNGLPIEILFMERIDKTNVRLSANPQAGISKVADLKGKKLGVAVGSTSHYHTLQALSQNGLTPSDVTIVNLTPANMPPAYTAGQIDAAFVWEPNIGAIERAGAKAIASTDSLNMITGGVWVARKPFVAQNPETVKRFLTAWRQAQKDYKADPKAVRQYEAKRVNMSPEQFDLLIEGQSASNPDFEEILTAGFMGPPGKEMDSRLMKHLQGIAAFLVQEKRIPAPPADWSGIFNTKPIQALLASK
ncbi:MAG: aliphatic sulfonate ABC transporter substrate-binding protein [Pseudorhodoplanes sp.]